MEIYSLGIKMKHDRNLGKLAQNNPIEAKPTKPTLSSPL